jgi:molybdopterin-guanine dinucleotide biosynthesis protein
LPRDESSRSDPCRLIVVGGHTRSIGKTALVCELIRALPEAGWVAGKITQYGHGVCAANGRDCDCAPTEHVRALDWETDARSGTDSGRFLEAGALRSFWLRTKQGYLAEGLPLLREALAGAAAQAGARGALNVIVESNSLVQLVKPALYLTVLDPRQPDFKDSARRTLDRADVFVFRGVEPGPQRVSWSPLAAGLAAAKLCVVEREGDPLPEPVVERVRQVLRARAAVRL